MNMASHFSTEASALYTFVASLSQTRIMHAGHKLSHHCVPNVQITGIPEWGRDCRAALSPVEPSLGVQRLRTALPYHLTPLTPISHTQTDIRCAGYIRCMGLSHERSHGVIWAGGGVSSKIYSVSLENWFLYLSRKACWLMTIC